jgi:hypothetical protein
MFVHEVRFSEISGSHGGEHEDDCLLGCCALMMEAVRISETSVILYETTRRNIPDGSHLQVRSSNSPPLYRLFNKMRVTQSCKVESYKFSLIFLIWLFLP